MDPKVIAYLKALGEGVTVLLQHHVQAEPLSFQPGAIQHEKAYSILDKIKNFDWEVGGPVYPEKAKGAKP